MFLKHTCRIFFLLVALTASSNATEVKKLLGWMYSTRGAHVDVGETGHVLQQLMSLDRENLDQRDVEAISNLDYLSGLQHYSLDKCHLLDEARELRSKAVQLMLINQFTIADFISFHVKKQAEFCSHHLEDLVRQAVGTMYLDRLELLMEPITSIRPTDEELLDAVTAYMKRVAPMKKKKSSFDVLGKRKAKQKHAAAFTSEIVDSICHPLIARMRPIHDLLASFDKNKTHYELSASTRLLLERDTHCTDILKNSKAIRELSYKKMVKELDRKEDGEADEEDVELEAGEK